MSLLQLVRVSVGQVGVQPGEVRMLTTADLATITAAGYLNGVGLQLQEVNLSPLDVIQCMYSYDSVLGTGSYAVLVVGISNGVITLTAWASPGAPPLAHNHILVGNSSNIATDVPMSGDATIVASGALTIANGAINNAKVAANAAIDFSKLAVLASGNLLVGSAGGVATSVAMSGDATIIASGALTLAASITKAAGMAFNSSSASATPGTVRALKGLMTLSNATYANSSNSVAGVRGEVDMVGASSGFVYGVQGKVIPTGTLSGSIWAPAIFGQYDLSGATINAGQIAAIWGDMGASGGTFTDVTGARMFAGTNTIASLTLNSMIYLYGKATSLLELSGSSSTYISTPAGSTPSGDLKALAITIDGVVHYILAAAVYS